MARKRRVTVAGMRLRRGIKMPEGLGWRLVSPSGRRGFKAALVSTFSLGGKRVALFKVLRGLKPRELP
jgi:hypothetical protein